MPTVGRRAAEQRDRAYAPYEVTFAWLAERARKEDPKLVPLRNAIARILVIAITELIASEVRAGRHLRLVELEDELVFLTVKLVADDTTALRALDRNRRRPSP